MFALSATARAGMYAVEKITLVNYLGKNYGQKYVVRIAKMTYFTVICTGLSHIVFNYLFLSLLFKSLSAHMVRKPCRETLELGI